MTQVLAHRGCTVAHPENTLDAFTAARRTGAHGVELDVHRAADGTLVVHHDPDIPGVGPVAALRSGDLPPAVPTLAQALDTCRGLVVNVELKAVPPDGPGAGDLLVRTVVGLLRRRRVDNVVVSSFEVDLVDAARRADPALEVALLVTWRADARAVLEHAIDRGYQGLHPFVTQVDAALVARAREAGVAVRVWTVNAPEDLRAMGDLGVDAVITDRPAEALALLTAGPAAT